MLIDIPNQLTSEEEQLLKKIAKMKKKKKSFIEKKSQAKDSHQESHLTNTTVSTAVKRTSTGTPNAKTQMDAKEAAKMLIQSGVIKLETESKDKGFKRSCSRKDDSRKLSLNQQESFDSNNKATYSSVNSPMSAKSPPFSPGTNPFFNNPNNNQQKFTRSPSFNNNNNNNNFRRNSFQNNYNNNGNNQTPGGGNNVRFQKNNFHNNNYNNNNNNNNQNGFSLYIKANNVNEELLRSIFGANVPNAKLISVDVKTNFAFVTVDSKDSADNAISEINGKTFKDSIYSVSYARPKNSNNNNNRFNRNNSYHSNYERSNSFNSNNNNNNNNSDGANQSGASGPPSRNSSLSPATNNEQTPPHIPSNVPRQMINYEDI